LIFLENEKSDEHVAPLSPMIRALESEFDLLGAIGRYRVVPWMTFETLNL